MASSSLSKLSKQSLPLWVASYWLALHWLVNPYYKGGTLLIQSISIKVLQCFTVFNCLLIHEKPPTFATIWTAESVPCPAQPPPSAAARHSLWDYSYTQSLSHPLLQRVSRSLSELSGKKGGKRSPIWGTLWWFIISDRNSSNSKRTVQTVLI